MRAWAVTGAWRGDLRLFGRIAQKAIDEVGALDQPAPCAIEFAVRNDCECYVSVADMLEFAPASTLRSFSSARIRVGGSDLYVEVQFGRNRAHREAAFSCPFGVSVQVYSNGAVSVASLRQIREAMARLVARGGLVKARPPAAGIDQGEKEMKKALARRWQHRELIVQLMLLLVSSLVLLCLLVTVRVISLAGGSGELIDLVLDPRVPYVVLGLTQPLPYLFPAFLFPAVEIADATPGKRLAQNLGRSGVVTAIVSVIVRLAFSA